MCPSVVVNMQYCIVGNCVGNRYFDFSYVLYYSRNKCIISGTFIAAIILYADFNHSE